MKKEKLEFDVVPTIDNAALSKVSAMFGSTMANELREQLEKTRADQQLKLAGRMYGQITSPNASPGYRWGSAIGTGLGAGARTASMIGTGAVKGTLGGIASIEGIVSSIERFVSKANPGVMMLFNQALDDTLAVLGHALVPAFQILTPLMRLMGDFMAGIIPDQKVINDYMKALAPVFDALRSALTAIAPLLKDLSEVYFVMLGKAIEWISDKIKKVVDVVKPSVESMEADLAHMKEVRQRQGVFSPEWASEEAIKKQEQKIAEAKAAATGGGGLPSSVGAAAKGANYSQFTDLSRTLAAAAFGAGVDPQRRTADATEKLVTLQLETLGEWRKNTRNNEGPAFAQ